jgi:hypothetical protein
MKRYLLPALLVLPLVLIGCGSSTSPEGIANSAAISLKKAGSIIDGVSDEASAKAALPGINAAIAEFKGYQAQFQGLKDVPMGEGFKATATILSATLELMAKAEALKAKNPAAAKIVMTELDKIDRQ